MGRKKRWSVWCGGMAVCLSILVACGDDPRQLYETARFEERQGNLPHAQELYERIVREHPDSSYAREAAQRLADLRSDGE